MITTIEDKKRWKEDGRKQKAIYLIVVCDTFDYADYPVYVKSGQNLEKVKSKYDGKGMQKIMEIIKLN